MRIAIVDYQMGNLRSVQKALEKVGAQAHVTSQVSEIEMADKIVLPGVGAFGDAMRELQQRQLIEPLKRMIDEDRCFLGICLGLQLLFERGYEGGLHQGLGILKGEVRKFDLPSQYKVPHMGWNSLIVEQPNCPLMRGLPESAQVYFVHSFYAVPIDPQVTAASTDYGGSFCSAVGRGNLFATQFHPEKSQEVGLELLKNFVRL